MTKIQGTLKMMKSGQAIECDLADLQKQFGRRGSIASLPGTVVVLASRPASRWEITSVASSYGRGTELVYLSVKPA